MKRYPHYLVGIAREQRKSATPAEAAFWKLVRNRQFNGLKFRRQHRIGRFIVDFYCAEKHLAIELDGGIHTEEDQKAYGRHRSEFLDSRGVNILRFWNDDLLRNPGKILREIMAWIANADSQAD